MKKLQLITILILAAVSAHAFDASVGIEQRYDMSVPNPLNQYGLIDIGHTTDLIDLFWSFSVCNDDKYQPSHGDDLFLGFYIFLENAGVSLDFENLNLTLGRTTLTDAIDSPYSLFISSRIIPALLADISFDDGTFFYTSRWTELNRDSALGFPDRGWQYNTYGIYLGDFKIGFQDSLVYTERSFDAEYFLNPLPGFLKQYTRVSTGKPWQVDGNDNSIMGFFVEYSPENLYSYGQILIDDFNANAIFNPDSYQNPNKIAWSLGGRYSFDFGDIGLYHAGATKYTFQAFGSAASDTQYGYSFYPAATYTANGVIMPIELEDNYIGYYNGENNFSLLADYEGTIEGIGIYSSLEFSLSGDKSPANPWTEYSWWTEVPDAGTKFLDSDVLEKKLVLTAGASRALPELGLPKLTVSAALELGYTWNVLELVDTLSSDFPQIQYWTPSDENEFVFSISVGAIYSF
ncbi:MAG: hypothetical protein JEZ04_10875 [Spirochaetales bacterium]|nr:hypothetical protein [Spirochaetales bacterium]